MDAWLNEVRDEIERARVKFPRNEKLLTDDVAKRNALLDKALDLAAREALKRAEREPWAANAPWIMAFKEWALLHGADDPSGAMLWADLHIATILHAVNHFARLEAEVRAQAERCAQLEEALRDLTPDNINDVSLNEWARRQAKARALLGVEDSHG